MTFTYGELNKHKVKELRNLCKYYKIEYKKSMRKGELIDSILEKFWVDDYKHEDVVQKSVRVKRLERLNKRR